MVVSAAIRILGGYFVAKLIVLNYLLLSEINLHMDVLVGWTESYLIMLSQTIRSKYVQSSHNHHNHN